MTSLRRRLERRDERAQERAELEAERAIRAAQTAPFGSVEARNNPLAYGSVFRAQYASLANAYDRSADEAEELGRANGSDHVSGLRRRALSRSPWSR